MRDLSAHDSPLRIAKAISRSNTQLWILASSIIWLLGIGLLLLMAPIVFWFRDEVNVAAPERFFYGLCIVLSLIPAYLLQRNAITRKLLDAALLQSAFHDQLTKLPNRAMFLDRLAFAHNRAIRHTDYRFAVLYMDLNRFKILNDSLGHSIGDQLLAETGSRLQASLRSTDMIARMGGDEFALLVDDSKELSDVIKTVERIQHQFAKPFQLAGRDVFVSTSIGIALNSNSRENPETLLRDADTAMYRSKASGEGKYEIFDPSMHQEAMKELELEIELRQAVDQNQLVLHYQPIVSLHQRKVVGFEALLRWQHPKRGLIYPDSFIPFSEDREVIIDLTRWTLAEACSQLRKWHIQFRNPSIFMSVNLPAKYLMKRELSDDILTVLSQEELPRQSLRLEITESRLLKDAEQVAKSLKQLTESGVKIHIDDFGTGFSSFSYLALLPVHALKIDRSFIQNLENDERHATIVRTVVSLANNLNLEVIAEGVETKQQLEFLRAAKCELYQGFYFAKALDREKAGALLLEQTAGIGNNNVALSRLRKFDLTSGLDEKCLVEMANTCTVSTFEKGVVFLKEGEIGDSIYFLEEGSVGIFRGSSQKPLFHAVLRAPTIVGEMAAVNPERIRTANVQALSDVLLLNLPIRDLLSLTRRFPLLEDNLLNLVAGRTLRNNTVKTVYSDRSGANAESRR